MATKFWTGSISTNPQIAGNWSDGSIPVSGDTVVFNEIATASCIGILSEVTATQAAIYLDLVIVEDDFSHDYQLGSAKTEGKYLTLHAKSIIINRAASSTRYSDFYLDLVEAASTGSGSGWGGTNKTVHVNGGKWGHGYTGPYDIKDAVDAGADNYSVEFNEIPDTGLYIKGNVTSIALEGTNDNPIWGTVELFSGDSRPSVCSNLEVKGYTRQGNSKGTDDFRVLVNTNQKGYIASSSDSLETLKVQTYSGAEVYCWVGEIGVITVSPTNASQDPAGKTCKNMVFLGSPYRDAVVVPEAARNNAVAQIIMSHQPNTATDEQLYKHNRDIPTRQDVFCVYPTDIAMLTMSGGYLRFFIQGGVESGVTTTYGDPGTCKLAHYIRDGLLSGNAVVKTHSLQFSDTNSLNLRFFVDNLQIRSEECLLEFPRDSRVQSRDTDFTYVDTCTPCYEAGFSTDAGSSDWWGSSDWPSSDFGSSSDWWDPGSSDDPGWKGWTWV